MRVLVLGATGMLGHKLVQVLAPEFEVVAGIRGPRSSWPGAICAAAVEPGLDVMQDTLAAVLDRVRPDAVLNAVGLIKQAIGPDSRAETIALNALYPNRLASWCDRRGIRLIHYSTDCVFSGAAGSQRGPNGYRESDPPDARDLYGLSKLLGEPDTPGSLVLRTSIIGRELRGRQSLLEWFLAQGPGPIRGFTKALFTGLTTLELAGVTARLLRSHPGLTGLWHVAADPIDKHSLLGLAKLSFGSATEIAPYDEFYCDRRLDGTRFSAATGWRAPEWSTLIEAIAEDRFDYAGTAA